MFGRLGIYPWAGRPPQRSSILIAKCRAPSLRAPLDLADYPAEFLERIIHEAYLPFPLAFQKYDPVSPRRVRYDPRTHPCEHSKKAVRA